MHRYIWCASYFDMWMPASKPAFAQYFVGSLSIHRMIHHYIGTAYYLSIPRLPTLFICFGRFLFRLKEPHICKSLLYHHWAQQVKLYGIAKKRSIICCGCCYWRYCCYYLNWQSGRGKNDLTLHSTQIIRIIFVYLPIVERFVFLLDFFLSFHANFFSFLSVMRLFRKNWRLSFLYSCLRHMVHYRWHSARNKFLAYKYICMNYVYTTFR